ncbi:MAG: putative metal-binding motif-containing protein, partial [Myxococcota bacterium]|nr:putative metal-binding motif-containing protein [Myxococcota bacterium]
PSFTGTSTPYGGGGTCVSEDPSAGATDYVLNNTDCNDAFEFTSAGGETLLASQQHPNTTWYIDIDGDDYGADNTDPDIYVVPNLAEDGVCHCESDCGTLVDCNSYDSADAATPGCEPLSASVCDVPSELRQCMDPASTSAATAGDEEFLPSDYTYLDQWMLTGGDCAEIVATTAQTLAAAINPGQTETCDPSNVDEDCNGFADDDEVFGADINDVYKYYNDTDTDGYADSDSSEFSCDGNVSLSNPIVYSYYTIEADENDSDNSYFEDSDGDCFCASSGTDCVDPNGDTCTPTGTETEVLAASVDCYCTESTCTKVCQNLAQEECTVSSAGTCAEGDFADPDWFYSFDQYDCNDNDDTVYPAAEELCDGQLNDCYNEADGTPEDEIDYDNDDFVECGYTSGWSTSNEPSVGVDCSPDDSNVYPNAADECDGQYNNCSVWVDKFVDADGDCFCNSNSCDDYCVTKSSPADGEYAEVCTPTTNASLTSIYTDLSCFCPDSTGTNTCVGMDGVVCAPDTTALTSTVAYYVDEDADCACESDGQDCLDSDGFTCSPTGTVATVTDYMDCADSGSTMSDGAPADQVDNDDDCYVECFTNQITWWGGSVGLGDSCPSTQVEPSTGMDCDDSDLTVYPGADEVCDGQVNDCDNPSLANDETDDDEDGYVDCDYDALTWSGEGSVVGGNDCDDAYESTFPGANEVCDGEVNNCDNEADGVPEDETDDDADGFVECIYNPSTWRGNAISGGEDCLDDSTTSYADQVYPGAPEYCDGIYNDCENFEYDANETPADEADDDGDGFVDCTEDAVWYGSGTPDYEDCDDDDDTIYPGAEELCDGQFNDCTNSDYDPDGAPTDEADNDGDGSAASPDCINSDCDDDDDSVYPGAEELCDGKFNDCNHPLQSDFVAAVGDCYCPDSSGSSTGCVTAAGAACTPTSNSGTVMTDYVGITVEIGTTTYASADVEYYCPSTDCRLDADDNDICDCLEPDGTACVITDLDLNLDGIADDCINSVVDDGILMTPGGSSVFELARGTQLGSTYSAPTDETDEDLDKFVECDYDEDVWDNSAGPYVDGGGDCDDSYDASDSYHAAYYVYPGAKEYCDGQYNDCNDEAYDADSAPTNEDDSDGDKHVDCDTTDGILWVGTSPALPYPYYTSLGIDGGSEVYIAEVESGSCYCSDSACTTSCRDNNGNTCSPSDADSDGTTTCERIVELADCDDNEDTIYPGAEALCDTRFNDCNADDYDPTATPVDESDVDGDGFAACSGDSSIESDCDDTDDTIFPGADELCDGVFNDCTSPLLGEFSSIIGTGCYCDGEDGSTALCTTLAGETCAPEDSDSDNVADNFYVTSRLIDGTTYESGIYDPSTACYCPTVDCIVDNDKNLISDCYNAAGEICPIEDIDTDDNGTADNCLVDDDGETGAKDPDTDEVLVFSNTTGLSLENDAPPDEIDDDGDRDVECEYDETVWSDKGSTLINGGLDCDDVSEWADEVYVGADELCDGVYNNCGDPTYIADLAPEDETDDDGDGFVECFPEAGESWRLDATNPNSFIDPIIAAYTDVVRTSDIYATSDFFLPIFQDTGADPDTCFCPSRESDGDCEDDNCVKGDGTACTPVGACSVVSGFGDCDDDDATVRPYAEALCDGQENDCANSGVGWDGDTDSWPNPDEEINGIYSNVPSYERDDDGDGYVECFDGADWATEWVGYGSGSIIGDDDCDDDDEDIYPGAPEACDGVFNDCDAAMVQTYTGVVPDCYCEDDDGIIDPDGDGNSNCADSAGASCTPTDEDGDGIIDALVTFVEVVDISGTDYATAQATAFCFSETCALDGDNDGYEDCADINGDRTTPADADSPGTEGFGYADDCAGTAILDYTFGSGTLFGEYDSNGDGIIDAPLTEIDTDNDDYVECDETGGYSGGDWKGDTSTPYEGQDCDVDDATVYPSAEEVCDGQYNNCNTGTSGAPADEQDDDEDGWVECERRSIIDGTPLDWAGDLDGDGVIDDAPNVWFGDASGCFCPSEAVCSDGVGAATDEARCINESALQCTPTDCTLSAGSAENDPAFGLIFDKNLQDCDDEDEFTFPGASALEARDYGDGEPDPYMAGIAAYQCTRDADEDLYADAASTGDCGDPSTVCPGSDCDDSNGGVHPNQQETCQVGDQVDEDCNGDVNSAEGFTELDGWLAGTHPELYVDEDVDGFGTAEIDPVEACELTEGYSSNSTDCDDTNEIIYPGADEICDDVDQDCDSAIDEPELNKESGCVSMFKDQDNDGYGDFDEEVCLCQSGGDNFTINPNDGFTYVTFGGDCNDNYSILKPLSCEDNYDNDGDGRLDGDDDDCINGYDEYGDELESKIEFLDGHDNDCDGLVPAIEVDCDDDGSLPILPLEAYEIDLSEYPDYASYDAYREAWEDVGVRTALDLGLAVCDEGSSFEVVDCLGENTITLECDEFALESDEEGNYRVEGSGLWMVRYSDSDGGFGARYDGGYRSYSSIDGGRSTSEPGDCDDNCALRFPAGLAQESCDGIDNNCSDIDPGIDADGIPDALDPDIIIPGTVSPEEMDLDNDGYISCDALTSNRDETQYSDLDCGDGFSEGDEDCNTQCSLSSPNGAGGEERCDGFLNVCGGEDEGTDLDGDDLQTCGAWGDGVSELAEDVFMVVWIKDVNWAQRGSDPVDLLRPAAPDAPSPPSDGRSAFAAPQPPPPAVDTADTGADTGFGDTGADTGSVEDATPKVDSALADMIPLILPRTAPGTESVIACDEELEAQLRLLLGSGTLAAAMDDNSPSDLLLQACLRDDGDCTVVQFSLSEDVDEKTYDEIIGVSDVFGENLACEESPEQWIARSVWQHDRIVEARNTVVEHECLRLYGAECSDVELMNSQLINDWDTEMVSARRHLEADSLWWKELGRFEPSSLHTETMLTCWGDPSDAAGIGEETGGDCADDNASVSRDNAEGPGDLIGLYLGSAADCSTCLDGIDNNCDGNVDCADSACARCFIGQGVGCSRGDDAPCAQAGCSFAAPAGGAFLDRLFSAAFIALFAVLYRRRERR